jgi:hypothetical protein
VGVGFANVVQGPVAQGIAGKNKVVREMDLDNKKQKTYQDRRCGEGRITPKSSMTFINIYRKSAENGAAWWRSLGNF